MDRQTTGIKVPAWIETITVPGVVLGEEIGDYGIHPKDPKVYREAPTLAELWHAYFDKNPNGSFISPEYRGSVLSKRGYGEWASTFLKDGKEIIERPEKVFYDKKHGWVVEGGRAVSFEHFPEGKLPLEGWTLEYDRLTGFPSRTSKNRSDAERIFGSDASYFWYSSNGLRAVLRDFDLNDYYIYWGGFAGCGPFCVSAGYEPDDRFSVIGVRSSSSCAKLRARRPNVFRMIDL